MEKRHKRRFDSGANSHSDSRRPAERDRDRIIYSPSLRRLSGITQVAPSSADPACNVHNRLTHVLEVAQIGRSMTEQLLKDPKQKVIASTIGGVDPIVVEAACLAHDLGHPPFGHVTEDALNEKLEDNKIRGGFEGNAQTFRIVTRLDERRVGVTGLDLTRATLNALIKYPWPRGDSGKERHKWGYYGSDVIDFEFARELDAKGATRKSAEAELMEWSDDIAYSVHDLEDFYQVGKIPLDRLAKDEEERKRFFQGVEKVWKERKPEVLAHWEKYKDAFTEFLVTFIPFERPFDGSADQRKQLKNLTSFLVGRYIGGIKLRVPTNSSERYVEIDEDYERELSLLKELTWHYVIRDPALITQQHGQRHIIGGLFDVYYESASKRKHWHILPPRFHQIAESENVDSEEKKEERGRMVCEMISCMTENQAVTLYHRLNGINSGSPLATLFT